MAKHAYHDCTSKGHADVYLRLRCRLIQESNFIFELSVKARILKTNEKWIFILSNT